MSLLLAGASISVAGAQAPPAPRTVEQIDRALLVTYIHGINEQVAQQEVGPEGVPRIVEHLADPDYPRKDNLVAFLMYLGGPDERGALLQVFTDPALDVSIPENDRARLMVPHGLGQFAARGDRDSLDLLLAMTEGGETHPLIRKAAAAYPHQANERDFFVENALLGLAYSGTSAGRDRLIDVGLARIDATPGGRNVSGSALDYLDLMDEIATSHTTASAATAGTPGTPPPADDDSGGQSSGQWQDVRYDGDLGDAGDGYEPLDFDTQSRVHRNDLDYANHIDISNKMTDVVLDDVLHQGSIKMARADYASDLACCATLSRLGNQQTFGIPGDGRDSIDSGGESGIVIGHSVARVKVIRAINYCGGPGSNIIGCAYTPGWGMALVRLSLTSNEGLLWVHEYGHNTGSGHTADSQRIMYFSLVGNNNGLSQGECNRYHFAGGSTQQIRVDIGECEDTDGDSVNDVVDNCPLDVNTSQSDLDGDGVGSTCDNCFNVPNPGQENNDNDSNGNACDTDDDNDGIPDEEDCAPLNPFGGAPAGEATGVGFSDAETLTWTDGDPGFSSNVYRGGVVHGEESTWECLDPQEFDETLEVPVEPALGQVFGYLVTTENACGEAGAGEDSAGNPRIATDCAP